MNNSATAGQCKWMGVLEIFSHTWKELNIHHRKRMKSHIVGKLDLLPGDSNPGSSAKNYYLCFIFERIEQLMHGPAPCGE